MTLLHYPPPDALADSPIGIHPHKDTNVLTLLYPDPVGGLEVRTREDHWIQGDAPAGALLVNVGEMLQLWSGGEFVATPHRVVNTSKDDRYCSLRPRSSISALSTDDRPCRWAVD